MYTDTKKHFIVKLIHSLLRSKSNNGHTNGQNKLRCNFPIPSGGMANTSNSIFNKLISFKMCDHWPLIHYFNKVGADCRIRLRLRAVDWVATHGPPLYKSFLHFYVGNHEHTNSGKTSKNLMKATLDIFDTKLQVHNIFCLGGASVLSCLSQWAPMATCCTVEMERSLRIILHIHFGEMFSTFRK
ncbi:hypothetical protein AGLY_015073 [Aphis glycines]|uniref:Uncharacterized protein n=1 Tax=Aphis glycines TaxID=307491 RepID=A0A6G0T309_APHGL|nr:hypothetical protein AGLY_015073 [Aphis glycines]